MTTPSNITSTSRRTRRMVAALWVAIAAVLAVGCSPPPAPQPSTATPEAFTFTGRGWGHGIGMSQYGAKGRADAGHSYTQILAHYYPATTLSNWPTTDDLRVLIVEAAPVLTFRTGASTTFEADTVPAGSLVTATRSGNNIVLGGAVNLTASSITISYADHVGALRTGDLQIVETNNTYRYGTITLTADPRGGVRAVVGNLTMDEYLYGLAEMPASWHPHALRAQVVAARTYAQRRSDGRARQLDHDLLATTAEQVYRGSATQDPRWVDAVQATSNQVLTYRGELILAAYSSSNGGYSSASGYTWSSQLDYLVAHPDPFDASPANANSSWSRTYTAAQLGAWFGVGTATAITITGNIEISGRVDRATVTITGTTGTTALSGAQFRATVNANNTHGQQMLSTNFSTQITK